MAQDEGGFGCISRAKRCWAPPGVCPHVSAQVVQEYTSVYAVVVPALGQMVSLILPEASTAMMNLFLAQVSQTFPKHFIVMQVGVTISIWEKPTLRTLHPNKRSNELR